jgi:hypothetical protein
METKSQRSSKKKFLLILGLILGVALLGGGVFASTSITLNGGAAVNLGAGTAAVNACNSAATVSTQTYYNVSQAKYLLGTISLAGIDDASGYCQGKTIQMAFVINGTPYTTSWTVPSSGATASDTYTDSIFPTGLYNSNNTNLATPGYDISTGNGLQTVAISVE